MPLFIDTLDRDQPYEALGEHYGSYPVLRIQDAAGNELAPRLDGNPLAGAIPIEALLAQFDAGREAYARRRP